MRRRRADCAEDHVGGSYRRYDVIRAGGDAAHAAAYPGHDSRVALLAPHVRTQPPHAANGADGDRRRDPCRHRDAPRRASRAVARTPPPVAEQPLLRIGLSATQKPIDEVARYLVGTAAEPCAIVDDRASPRHGPRNRSPRLLARSGDGARSLGRISRPAGSAHQDAPDDARLRQYAAHGGTAGAALERTAGRRCRRRASRQPVEGDAARRRVPVEGRSTARARGHGLPRARHRHRARRPRLPDWVAKPHRDASAARRAFRAHHRRTAQRPRLPDVARRPDRVCGAASLGPPRRARCHRHARRTARRPGAADRRRNGVRRVSRRRHVRSRARRVAVPRAVTRGFRCRASYVGRRIFDAARPPRGAAAPRRGQRTPARPARQPPARTDIRRRHP